MRPRKGDRLSSWPKRRLISRAEEVDTSHFKFIPFSALTKMSGVDVIDGEGKIVRSIRKGAVDAVTKYVEQMEGFLPLSLKAEIEKITRQGGTPLLVSNDRRIIGVIHLKDVIKGGIRELFSVKKDGDKDGHGDRGQPAYGCCHCC